MMAVPVAKEFEKELSNLINKNSLENASDTPDYILAKFLSDVFEAWNLAVRDRERHKTPVPEVVPNEAAIDTIKDIAYQSGLSTPVVQELLMKGWTYTQYRNSPSVWLDPSARLKRGAPHV